MSRASTSTRFGALDTSVGGLSTDVDALESRADGLDARLNLTLVTPLRIYDSRLDMSPTASGPVGVGGSRVIPARDARDVETGAIVATDVVPAGAVGIIFNFTLVGPSGSGFAAVGPQSATTVTASTLNFGPDSPTVQANSATTAIDGDREVRVIVNGPPGGQIDFIIDVLGYYS